jgi:predicted RNase H-like nuclease
LVIQFNGQQAQAQLVSSASEIRANCPDNTPIWIDMPIGLVDQGPQGRACDQLARRILSPVRHSSVFTPPCRAAVYATKEEASAVNYACTNKKLSRQSLNILPKIQELDICLQVQESAEQMRWFEAHPEVVFAAFQGLKPLRHSKKTTLGQTQRHQLLKTYFPNISLWFDAVRANFPKATVTTDDIHDALALAVGAYLVSSGQATLSSLPEQPPVDSSGLLMRIVYAEV